VVEAGEAGLVQELVSTLPQEMITVVVISQSRMILKDSPQ
jgi:hypothetical protein